MNLLIKAYELKINDIFYIQNFKKEYKVLYNNRRKVKIIENGDDDENSKWIEGYTDVHLKLGSNVKTNLLSYNTLNLLYKNNSLNDVLEAMEDYKDISLQIENSKTKIFKDSLATALYIAIEEREKEENKMGYNSDSAMLSVWKDVLNKLKNGENISTK